MKSYSYMNESAEVFVTPMVDKFEDDGPWPYRVAIAPLTPLLPSWEVVVMETSGFGAASEAMHEYKKRHKMNLSTVWGL